MSRGVAFACTLAVGGLIALQPPANAALARHVGDLGAALISAVITVTILQHGRRYGINPMRRRLTCLRRRARAATFYRAPRLPAAFACRWRRKTSRSSRRWSLMMPFTPRSRSLLMVDSSLIVHT
jgi:hypothetical protein